MKDEGYAMPEGLTPLDPIALGWRIVDGEWVAPQGKIDLSNLFIGNDWRNGIKPPVPLPTPPDP